MQAFGLGYEEEDEDEAREGESGEQEECPRRAEMLGEGQEGLADDEVGAPIGDSSDAATETSVLERIDLRVNDPRHRPHARGVDDDVQCKEYDRHETNLAGTPLRVPCSLHSPARRSHIVVQNQTRTHRMLIVGSS